MKRVIPARRAGASRSRGPSHLEELFAIHVRAEGLAPAEREYRFARPERQWRFDFAWPAALVAVEIEGGIWAKGRHTRGSGFTDDCEKYNAAALRGWRVFRFTDAMVESGAAINTIKAALAAEPKE